MKIQLSILRWFSWMVLVSAATVACKTPLPIAPNKPGSLPANPQPVHSKRGSISAKVSSQQPWIARARAHVGKSPLLLVKAKDGIESCTPDGSCAENLTGFSTNEVLLDSRAEILWVRIGDRLQVVDLREVHPQAHPIALGVPEGAALQIITKRDDTEYTVERPSMCDIGNLFILTWQASPTIEFIGERSGRPRLVGDSWLRENIARDRGPSPAAHDLWLKSDQQRTPLVRSLRRCDDPEDCGRSVPFGPLGWLLVLTGAKEGADCHPMDCVLFDPSRKLWASPNDPTTWVSPAHVRPGSCGPYQFDLSQKWYVLEEKVCSVSQGCNSLGSGIIGWLPPSAWVGAPM